MIFYKGNRVEVNLNLHEVAGQFCTFMLSQESGSDWRLKLDNWPFERTFRNWLTSGEGLNVSWRDEDGYRELETLTWGKVKESALW